MTQSPELLIFEALCTRYRSTASVGRTMTLHELQAATGLSEAALRDAVDTLRGGPGNRTDDSKIAYEGDRILLGWLWRESCRDLGTSR